MTLKVQRMILKITLKMRKLIIHSKRTSQMTKIGDSTVNDIVEGERERERDE